MSLRGGWSCVCSSDKNKLKNTIQTGQMRQIKGAIPDPKLKRHGHQVNGITYRDGLAGLRQLAGFGIAPEKHNLIAVLIGGQKKVPLRSDQKVARRLSQGGLPSGNTQFSAAGIDCVNGKLIGLAAVGGVQKLPVGRNADLGGAGLPGETGGGQGYLLDLGKNAVPMAENTDLTGQLQYQIGKGSFGIKNQVPRSPTRLNGNVRRLRGRKRPVGTPGLVMVGIDPIRAQIACKQKVPVGRE